SADPGQDRHPRPRQGRQIPLGVEMLYTLAYMAAAFFGGNAAAIKLICELAALGESPKKGGFVPKFSPRWRFWTLNLSGVICFGVSCLSLLSIMLTPQANGRQVA